MSLKEILVGADPEFFVIDKETRKPLSAYGMLPGTKREPFKVPDGAVQIDGMATEFNITPARTSEQFDKNIASVMASMVKMLPANVELTDLPTAMFDPELFAAQPKEALEFGCDPDYNAYTGTVNEKPRTELPMRTAGGHVHIGWTNGKSLDDPNHDADCKEVVKQLDFYLGTPSLLWDSDKQRRQLYGQPGCYRKKPYGVEYRSLSCVWAFDQTLRKFVFDATVGAIRDLYNGFVARQELGDTWAQFQMLNGYDYSERPYDCTGHLVDGGSPFFEGYDLASFRLYCKKYRRERDAANLHKLKKERNPFDGITMGVHDGAKRVPIPAQGLHVGDIAHARRILEEAMPHQRDF